MIERRPFSDLRHVARGWLNARFHFVPPEMGGDPAKAFAPIDAWNDDEVAGHSGFPEHPHEDAEIVTFVREGQITHRDSLGNHGVAGPGQVQAISAGAGIRHTERNDGDASTRLFQIWLRPRQPGGKANWGTSTLPERGSTGGFLALASSDGADANAVPINADARVLAARLIAGERLVHELRSPGRGYLVPTVGMIRVNGTDVDARDGCLLTEERTITIEAAADTEVVLVECLS